MQNLEKRSRKTKEKKIKMFSSSLKYSILQKVKGRYPGWMGGIEGEEFALRNRFKASNVSRRLRELCNEGLIERRIFNGHVEYRWLPPIPKTTEEQEKESLQRLIHATG